MSGNVPAAARDVHRQQFFDNLPIRVVPQMDEHAPGLVNFVVPDDRFSFGFGQQARSASAQQQDDVVQANTSAGEHIAQE